MYKEQGNPTTKEKVMKQLACPTPKRTYNLDHLGFMKYEGVKFYSENIHLVNRKKGQQNASFRGATKISGKRRRKFMNLQNKFGIKFKVKESASIIEETNNEKEEDKIIEIKKPEIKEKELKDTKGSSSKDQGSKENINETDNYNEGDMPPEIDRCSNPMSHLLEENPAFEFDGSITEEDSDEELDNSFEF